MHVVREVLLYSVAREPDAERRRDRGLRHTGAECRTHPCRGASRGVRPCSSLSQALASAQEVRQSTRRAMAQGQGGVGRGTVQPERARVRDEGVRHGCGSAARVRRARRRRGLSASVGSRRQRHVRVPATH